MGEMQIQMMERLLDTLEAQAKSNGELATEVRSQGEKTTDLAGEVRDLAASVDRNTSATNRLVHAVEAERKARSAKMESIARVVEALTWQRLLALCALVLVVYVVAQGWSVGALEPLFQVLPWVGA